MQSRIDDRQRPLQVWVVNKFSELCNKPQFKNEKEVLKLLNAYHTMVVNKQLERSLRELKREYEQNKIDDVTFIEELGELYHNYHDSKINASKSISTSHIMYSEYVGE